MNADKKGTARGAPEPVLKDMPGDRCKATPNGRHLWDDFVVLPAHVAGMQRCQVCGSIRAVGMREPPPEPAKARPGREGEP